MRSPWARMLNRTVYRIGNHSFSKALKRRILSSSFVACIHCKLYVPPTLTVPFSFRSTRQYGDHNLEFSLEEWQSVLKLAARYEMAEIRIFVIKKMTPLLADFPSLQIHLARTYNIQSWLGLGLSRLSRRAEPLNEEDVRLVGLSDSLKICALRERKRRCDKCDSCRANTHSGGFTKDELGQEFGIRESDLPPFNKLCACSKRAVSDSESEGRSTWSLVLLSTERLSFITSYAESFKNENPTGPERGKKYYTALMLWMLDGHESEITIDISPCCCNLPSFPRTLSPLPKPRMRLSPNSNLTH